jgi:mannan endo-1,6-alpha-mannosidase
MQNYTNSSDIWVERTNGLLDATSTFFSPYKNGSKILFEAQCELDYSCNVDQLSMKAYLVRWMACTSQLAPWTAGKIGDLLRTSAQGAAASCSGPPDGNTCGVRWYINGFDDKTGLGQQLSALEVMYALLVNETTPPATLPNVVIRDVPDNITISTSHTPPSPSSEPTARPLFDSHQGAASQLNVLLSASVTLGMAWGFIFLMT